MMSGRQGHRRPCQAQPGGMGVLETFIHFSQKILSYHKVILARWLFAGGCWLLVAGVFCLLFAVDR